jgi:hypothetical protein
MDGWEAPCPEHLHTTYGEVLLADSMLGLAWSMVESPQVGAVHKLQIVLHTEGYPGTPGNDHQIRGGHRPADVLASLRQNHKSQFQCSTGYLPHQRDVLLIKSLRHPNMVIFDRCLDRCIQSLYQHQGTSVVPRTSCARKI